MNVDYIILKKCRYCNKNSTEIYYWGNDKNDPLYLCRECLIEVDDMYDLHLKAVNLLEGDEDDIRRTMDRCCQKKL